MDTENKQCISKLHRAGMNRYRHRYKTTTLVYLLTATIITAVVVQSRIIKELLFNEIKLFTLQTVSQQQQDIINNY